MAAKRSPTWYSTLSDKPGNARPLLRENPRPGFVIERQFTGKSGNYEKREFAAMDSVMEIYDLVKKTYAYCLHEKAGERMPQKPRFDLDIEASKVTEEMVAGDELYEDLPLHLRLGEIIKDAVLEAAIQVLSTRGVKLVPERNFVVCTSHGEEKASYHLLIHGLHHANSQEARAFAQEVTKGLPEVWRKNEFIDMGIYSSWHSLRMVGSTKNGRKMRWNKEFVYKGQEYEHEEGDFGCLKRAAIKRQLYGRTLVTYTSDQSNPCPNFFVPKGFSPSEEVADETVQAALAMVDEDTFELAGVEGNMVRLTRLAPSYCKTCEREHEHENPSLIIVGSQVRFHCWRHHNNRYSVLGVIKPPAFSLEELKDSENAVDRQLYELVQAEVVKPRVTLPPVPTVDIAEIVSRHVRPPEIRVKAASSAEVSDPIEKDEGADTPIDVAKMEASTKEFNKVRVPDREIDVYLPYTISRDVNHTFGAVMQKYSGVIYFKGIGDLDEKCAEVEAKVKELKTPIGGSKPTKPDCGWETLALRTILKEHAEGVDLLKAQLEKALSQCCRLVVEGGKTNLYYRESLTRQYAIGQIKSVTSSKRLRYMSYKRDARCKTRDVYRPELISICLRQFIEDSPALVSLSTTFIPYTDDAPPVGEPDVLNIFPGFVSKIIPEGVVCDEEYMDRKKLHSALQWWCHHIWKVGANEDDRIYRILQTFWARYVTHPGTRAEIMPILMGLRGAGKDIIKDIIIKCLLGIDLCHVYGKIGQMAGQRFNGEIAYKLLVACEEMDDPKRSGGYNVKNQLEEFKSSITAKYVNIEKKGVEKGNVPNMTSYIGASNIAADGKGVIPLTEDERRIFPILTNGIYRKDRRYFRKLSAMTYDNPEFGDILHTFYRSDWFKENVMTEEVSPMEIIDTDYVLKCKSAAETRPEQFIISLVEDSYAELDESSVHFVESKGAPFISSKALFDKYLSWYKRTIRRTDDMAGTEGVFIDTILSKAPQYFCGSGQHRHTVQDSHGGSRTVRARGVFMTLEFAMGAWVVSEDGETTQSVFDYLGVDEEKYTCDT